MWGGPPQRVPMTSVSFTINACSVQVAAYGDTPLLDVLRNHLGHTGTRLGCDLEQCGTCMVLSGCDAACGP
jgi:aerobic carbon-monoxide dehydrogenase small subunit